MDGRRGHFQGKAVHGIGDEPSGKGDQMTDLEEAFDRMQTIVYKKVYREEKLESALSTILSVSLIKAVPARELLEKITELARAGLK